MKKVLQLIFSLLIVLALLPFLFFLSDDLQMLDPAEQLELRSGKTFWRWNSPHGAFDVHYIEKGSGPRHILLLHGFRGSSFTWRFLIDYLSEAGFHVWAIDLIGFGLSDKPDNTQYSIHFFIQQIQDFAEGHGIDQAHFVGNSMGGGISLISALSFPEKVKSLVLISPLGYPIDVPMYISLGKYFHYLWPPFLTPAMIRKGMEQIVYHKEAISDDQVEAYSLPYRLPGGLGASLNTLRNFDNQLLKSFSSRYPSEIKCPLFVIWGEEDHLVPVRHCEYFCKDFPHASKLLIKECGHIPQEEYPDVVGEKIVEFLNGLKTR